MCDEVDVSFADAGHGESPLVDLNADSTTNKKKRGGVSGRKMLTKMKRGSSFLGRDKDALEVPHVDVDVCGREEDQRDDDYEETAAYEVARHSFAFPAELKVMSEEEEEQPRQQHGTDGDGGYYSQVEKPEKQVDMDEVKTNNDESDSALVNSGAQQHKTPFEGDDDEETLDDRMEQVVEVAECEEGETECSSPRRRVLLRRRAKPATKEEELRRRACQASTLIKRATLRTERLRRRASKRMRRRQSSGDDLYGKNGEGNDLGAAVQVDSPKRMAFFDIHLVTLGHNDEVKMVGHIQRIVEMVASDDENRRLNHVEEISKVEDGENSANVERPTAADELDQQHLSLFEVLFELKWVDLLTDILLGGAFAAGGDKAKSTSSARTETTIREIILLPPITLANQCLKALSHLLRNVVSPSSLFLLLSNRKLHDLVTFPVELFSVADIPGIAGKDQSEARPLGTPLRRKTRHSGVIELAAIEELNASFVTFLKSMAIHVRAETSRFFLSLQRDRRSLSRRMIYTHPIAVNKGIGDNESFIDGSDSFPLYTRTLQLFTSCPIISPQVEDINGSRSDSAGGTLVRMSAADVCLVVLSRVAAAARRTDWRLVEFANDDLVLSHPERLDLIRYVSGPSNASYLVSPIATRLVRLCGALEDGIRLIDNLIARNEENIRSIVAGARAKDGEMMTIPLSPLSPLIELEQRQVQLHQPAGEDREMERTSAAVKERMKQEQELCADACHAATKDIERIVGEMETELLLLDNILKAGITSLNERAIELFLQTYVDHLLPQMLSIPILASGKDASLSPTFLSPFAKYPSNEQGTTAFLSEQISKLLLPRSLQQAKIKGQPCGTSREHHLNIAKAGMEEGLDLSPAKACLLGLTAALSTLTNRPLVHLIVTAVFHPMMPTRVAKKRHRAATVPSRSSIGGSPVEDKEDKALRVDDGIDSLSCYDFGRSTRFGKAADLAFGGDAFRQSAALADIMEGTGRTTTAPNHYCRAVMACLSGTGGASTVALQSFAKLLTRAASVSVHDDNLREALATLGRDGISGSNKGCIPTKPLSGTEDHVEGIHTSGSTKTKYDTIKTPEEHPKNSCNHFATNGTGSDRGLGSSQSANQFGGTAVESDVAGTKAIIKTKSDAPGSPQVPDSVTSSDPWAAESARFSWGPSENSSQTVPTPSMSNFQPNEDLGFIDKRKPFPTESPAPTPGNKFTRDTSFESDADHSTITDNSMSPNDWFHFDNSDAFHSAKKPDIGNTNNISPASNIQEVEVVGTRKQSRDKNDMYGDTDILSTNSAMSLDNDVLSQGSDIFSFSDAAEEDLDQDQDMLLSESTGSKKKGVSLPVKKKVSMAQITASASAKKKSVKKGMAKLMISTSTAISFERNTDDDDDSLVEI